MGIVIKERPSIYDMRTLMLLLFTGICAAFMGHYHYTPPLLQRVRTAACSPPCMLGDADDVARELSAHVQGRHVQFGEPDEILKSIDDVWVLLFRPGERSEGVYTLQGRMDSRTYILAFELSEDAQRFSSMLDAEGFDLPVPCQWTKDQLTDFCHSSGFTLSMVPKGSVLMPPMHNVYDHDAFEQMDRPAVESSPEEAKLSQAREDLERLFNLP